jgi:hypothetical protein
MIFSFGASGQIAFQRLLQSTGKTGLSMVSQLVGACFNIVFDPILIFGLFGFPAMGARGAPERWAVFFRYLTDRGKRRKINEIARYEEGIAMAGAAVMSISRDEAERFRLLGEHKRELDIQSGFVEAERAGERKGRREGKREGRLEGEQKGKLEGKLEGALEIARKLKRRNIPLEQIAEDTGLSADEIAGL